LKLDLVVILIAIQFGPADEATPPERDAAVSLAQSPRQKFVVTYSSLTLIDLFVVQDRDSFSEEGLDSQWYKCGVLRRRTPP
jgi:hypothetical protein